VEVVGPATDVAGEHALTDFTIVICTRDRPEHVLATLDALSTQSDRRHPVLVIDQSDTVDDRLRERAATDPLLEVVHDDGRGLSRARNLAWRRLRSTWVVYLDDDCRPEGAWESALATTLAGVGSDVGFVSGHVSGEDRPAGDYLEVTAFHVDEPRLRRGRWTRPWRIGFGVCMAVRHDVIERLGGWDERLGVGSPHGFGAGEDMDFNYRFLRSGGLALATPTVRARHQQWRSAAELPSLYERYLAGWSAFAVKQLRTGDRLGGIWLWLLGLQDVVRMVASAGRRRSRLRAVVAVAKARGLALGTARGLRFPW